MTSRTQPIVPVGLPCSSVVTLPCASIHRSVPSGQNIRLRRTYDDRFSIASWTTAITWSWSSGCSVASQASNVPSKPPGGIP